MINLVISSDQQKQIVKTIHLDEQTGNMFTRVSDVTNNDDILWLEQSLSDNCTIANYGVKKFKAGRRFEYEDIDSQKFNYDSVSSEYITEPSLLGLFRSLILVGAKIKYEGEMGTEYFNISGLQTANSSFSINLPILTEGLFEEFSWKTLKLIYNDPANNWLGYDKQLIIIPQSDLGEYERYITRLGTEVIKSGGTNLEYAIVKINKGLNFTTEKPIAFTAVKVLGTLQLLLEAYALILPLVGDLAFDRKDTVKSDAYSRPQLGYGGFVDIKSNYKVSPQLRDKFLTEVISIREHGEASSVLLSRNSLFKVFYNLFKSLQQVSSSKSECGKLYKNLVTLNALTAICMLEAKSNLFFYDKEYLEMLVKTPQIDTGIADYYLRVKVGGMAWRPTKLFY